MTGWFLSNQFVATVKEKKWWPVPFKLLTRTLFAACRCFLLILFSSSAHSRWWHILAGQPWQIPPALPRPSHCQRSGQQDGPGDIWGRGTVAIRDILTCQMWPLTFSQSQHSRMDSEFQFTFQFQTSSEIVRTMLRMSEITTPSSAPFTQPLSSNEVSFMLYYFSDRLLGIIT